MQINIFFRMKNNIVNGLFGDLNAILKYFSEHTEYMLPLALDF